MEVAERRAAVLAQWSRLKSAMVAWRHKLGQSKSMQHFKREADEAAAWMAEKMQIACDDSYKDPTNLSVRKILQNIYVIHSVTILLFSCSVTL